MAEGVFVGGRGGPPPTATYKIGGAASQNAFWGPGAPRGDFAGNFKNTWGFAPMFVYECSRILQVGRFALDPILVPEKVTLAI